MAKLLIINWQIPGVVDVLGVLGVPGISKSSWERLSDQETARRGGGRLPTLPLVSRFPFSCSAILLLPFSCSAILILFLKLSVTKSCASWEEGGRNTRERGGERSASDHSARLTRLNSILDTLLSRSCAMLLLMEKPYLPDYPQANSRRKPVT